MKGYLTSFSRLFELRPGGAPIVEDIEIPLIQRDYAQGRPGAGVEEIRTNFLEVLLGAVAGGEPVGLDFVYGKVERGTLQPLDGQQRLTTLFLLHWYLASAADDLDTNAPWTRFSYATRFSARRFCERLVEHPLPQGAVRPSEWIVDQPWYLHLWRDDPSIQSMLVMIDAIHNETRLLQPDLDAKTAWSRLTDAENPAVSFYLLPLDDMESDEDLYIKMNSRGKPLTPFENFKARFEQDIAHTDRADAFAHRIDGAWSDLLWPFHGGDNIVDDEFVRYIDFITEICELRDGRVVSERLGPRARRVFGEENERADEHLDFLFAAFDAWRDETHVVDVFDNAFSVWLPAGEQYDWRRVVLFGSSTTNLFEQCLHMFDSRRGGNRAFTLQQSLLLYAVLLHLIEESDDFPRRLRTLRNLIAASEDEVRRDRMPDLIGDVEGLIRSGDLDTVTRLSANQVDDERRKQELLDANPELSGALFRLEDNPILRGTLTAFELDAETFAQRAEAFEIAFADPRRWADLTGSLLATGDYQRQRPRSTAWQFGTSSSTNESVWRYLLTDGTHDGLSAVRTVLAEFLDGFAASAQDMEAYCAAVTDEWLSHRETSTHYDWRYYLVKYPALRGGDTGIYYGVDGELGYSMCMLRTKQLNGNYRDPILLGVWQSSDVGYRVQDPWFTGYDTSARWLRLLQSGVGMRSVGSGFALQRPEDDALDAKFVDICSKRADVEFNDDAILLKIPQVDDGRVPVDSADRVSVGADFLRTLVAAGL